MAASPIACIEVAAKPIGKEAIGNRIHDFRFRGAISQQSPHNIVGSASITKLKACPHSNSVADVNLVNRTIGDCRKMSTIVRVSERKKDFVS